MKNHDLIDISMMLKFYPNSGKSVAVTNGISKEIIFLPLSQVEVFETGRFEDGLQIVTVTMPQWLAEEKELV
jgi:hypothetical protein